jgi:integrase
MEQSRMSRPRDRVSATGLLPLMETRRWSDGKTVTYRYHPRGSKPVNLGTDRSEAIRKVLDMNGTGEHFGTLRWVWERFADAKSPSPKWARLTEGTRADYRLAWKQIDARLGHMNIAAISANIVARYVHVERTNAPRRANIEKSLLSRLFGHGIKLGVCQVNATIGVEPHDSEARTEAPDPALLAKFLVWIDQQTPQRRIIGLAADYASLAGNRRVEFLPLTWWQIDRKVGEIRTVRAKQRGKKREQVVEVVAVTPRLSGLLDRLEAIRQNECPHVFPTRDGNAYSDRGFKTLWQRSMRDAIKEGVLPKEARFTFHDLRAYYATQHKAERGTLPDLHKNPETTARVYDRSKVVRRSAL